jgi:transcriptional regulator with XRE-family HTH domain
MPLDTAKVATLRQAKGLSQAQAAALLGTSRQYWSQLEAAQIPNPSISTLEQLASALGVQPADLLTPALVPPNAD